VSTVPRLDVVDGLADLQAARLLERVRAALADARARAEWDADAQVEAILQAARRDARARLRSAARAKRERIAERCRKAAAEAETRDRTGEFAVAREFVARAAAALPLALERRWADPPSRARWCAAAVDLAARRLVAREWTVELDAPDDAVREALEARAAAAGARISWSAAEATGLRIRAGGATVDATVGGLLADRAAIASRLLAALESARRPTTGGAP
jgi:hypothetical protein